MSDFIMKHPQFVYIVCSLLIGLLIYFYKGNESKAALLIAGKLDNIAEKLDGLYKKDVDRKFEIKKVSDRVSKLETSFSAQVQRCNDREASCPGKQASHALERMRDRQRDVIEKDRREQNDIA